ncbi:MAG TPA: TIGR03435 family protein [Bryobacteraceae bacterium]|nr:TIGR03435 family protein [Bryobacteraceae bacterium]
MTLRQVALTGFLAVLPTPAQPPTDKPVRLEFEVASLKPNQSGNTGYSIAPRPGGKLQANNINLKRMIAVAYSLTDFQIFSNLSWLETQRYDMDAKASGPAALPDLRLMLRSLLEDRFKLKVHKETRDLPRYTLAPAKAGTLAGGPGLTEAPNGDCAASGSPQAALPNGTPCGVVNQGLGRINGNRGRISQLCDRLTTLLGVTVVDESGLKGIYDIAVTWTPDPSLERLPPGMEVPSDGPGLSLFMALQQQLGLKLVGGKGPVEVLVVDSAEKATEN